MGKWTRSRVDADQINGGNEYEIKDRLSLQQLNAMVNSGLYSQDFVENLVDDIDVSDANKQGVPTVSLVDYVKDGRTFKKFKFSNLKGQKGDSGEIGSIICKCTLNNVTSSTTEIGIESVIIPDGINIGKVPSVFILSANSNLYQVVGFNAIAMPNPETGQYEEEILGFQVEYLMNLKGQAGADGSGINPNLLINGDFRVNQRGLSEYTVEAGGNAKATVDRWITSHGTSVIVNNDKTITFRNNTGVNQRHLFQYIEGYEVLLGKTITISMKVKNATVGGKYRLGLYAGGSSVYSVNGVYNDTEEIIKCTITAPTSVANQKLGVIVYPLQDAVAGTSITIEYIKAELGSVATANNPRPYAEELAMCQRYYQIIKVVGGSGTVGNIGVPRNTTTLRFYINLLSQMRTIPTTGVKSSDVSIINLNTGAITQIDNNSLALQSETTNMVALNYITTGLTLGHIYNLTDNNGQLIIELDAEIY